MSRLICPECGEDVVPGTPRGGDGRGWSRGVQPERLTHRHNQRMTTTQTADLIAEYDARIAGRWVNCQLGSTRAASRQRAIDAIVDELSRRADAGDAEALAWYER